MSRYESLIAIKGSGSVIDKLRPASRQEISLLQARYPALPNDFLQFLEEVGYGTIGRSSYAIYSGVMEPDEVYGDGNSIEGVLLFGDDFAGWSVGLDVNTWRVVEIDPTNMAVLEIAETFSAFIIDKIREIETY